MPSRIAALPVDERGYPVPWFVSWVKGKPVFQAADQKKLVEAVRASKCWVCGDQLGRYRAFVIGPMCSINRISAEPPCHEECAVFSAMACPFLTKPRMGRKAMPEELADKALEPPGVMIARNPGCCAVWVTRDYRLRNVPNGVLFRLGDPTSVHWFAEGRPATRDEVMASIESGFPTLLEMAQAEGAEAVWQLSKQRESAEIHLPGIAA